MLTRMVQQIASFAQCGHHARMCTRSKAHLYGFISYTPLSTSASGVLDVQQRMLSNKLLLTH